MEYILGSVLTLAILVLSRKMFKVDEVIKPVKVNIHFKQSRKYELIKDILPYIPLEPKPIVSQATKHYDSRSTKILFIDDKAYWIDNGVLCQAEMQDGNVDMETKKTVDTITMNDVELKKMIFVVEKLTEGKRNESGNSGNQGL